MKTVNFLAIKINDGSLDQIILMKTELQVMTYIRAYPRSSIRHVSRELGILVGAKADFVTHLRIGDYERRLQFVAWFNVQFEIKNIFYNRILWTDDSKFTNNAIMNRQNNRFWHDTNPHWSQETNLSCRQSGA
ncbi:Hypothetical protein CINCED_3A002528 [Cinara cedri]|uniref:Uncharacterized protein n=1 Tax=Cinara cedri TaxID=506608 RepID=A0A5E4MK79_9HEMI|nr:Hypothetical protein CINCED_3A002528 [Cinara cedri]